ncbi:MULTISPECIES: pyruvate kinase [Anaerofustis]|uniref:pyruvate kinase n=1 Tax=Anaerofustis TaxID=264995 RepID=UPI0011068AD9|nr:MULTISPECIES: pyruvate kinase [Anaerofustis]
MKKTKIVCTIGPASEDKKILTHLVASGMNVARLNFSHGDYEEHQARIDTIKEIREKLNQPIAILLDTKGPEIRTKKFKDGGVFLKEGSMFTLYVGDELGDEHGCATTYDHLAEELKKGDVVLIDDGLIKLTVREIKGSDVVLRVDNGGPVKNHKSINIPGVNIKLPALTEKDTNDLLFGIKNDIDFVAASFIRSKEDVFAIREVLNNNGGEDIHIISKIENRQGVDNIDEIIEASDGIMVARGDLGVEIPAEEVPIVQKDIIKKCNYVGKPVITATQMLDSMINNPRATRAEVTDVFNAIFDGTDAIMLSGETAAGKYPIEAVQTMGIIAESAESKLASDFRTRSKYVNDKSMTSAVSLSTVQIADSLNAKAILTPTSSGYTARRISKHRPNCDIVAYTDKEYVQRRLSIVWGVDAYKIDVFSDVELLYKEVINSAKEHMHVKDGDIVVITAGIPLGVKGTTNSIRIETVGEHVLKGAGLISGRVRSNIRMYNDDLKDFKEGEILALTKCSKEAKPLLEKAGGVVYTEKALLNELAMELRTAGIPVLVGVESFEGFEDNDKVTLDATRGILYKTK